MKMWEDKEEEIKKGVEKMINFRLQTSILLVSKPQELAASGQHLLKQGHCIKHKEEEFNSSELLCSAKLQQFRKSQELLSSGKDFNDSKPSPCSNY